jgi:hypothetical protein
MVYVYKRGCICRCQRNRTNDRKKKTLERVTEERSSKDEKEKKSGKGRNRVGLASRMDGREEGLCGTRKPNRNKIVHCPRNGERKKVGGDGPKMGMERARPRRVCVRMGESQGGKDCG